MATPEQKQQELIEKIRAKHQLPPGAFIAPGAVRSWAAYFDGIVLFKEPVGKADAVLLQDISDLQFRPASTMINGTLKIVAGGAKPKKHSFAFGKPEEPAAIGLRDLLHAENQRGVRGVLTQDLVNQQSAPEIGISDEKFRAKYNIPADAVLARAPGVGYISFDGHFVTIQHIGMQRAVIGKGVKRFPITGITNIHLKPAGWVISGYLQITAGGSNETKSVFGRQTWDAAGDENTVVFGSQEQDAFLAVRDAIEQAQRNLHAPKPVIQGAQAPKEDVLTQLEKLASLRDAGILTEEEFTTKKADLLGRL